MRPQVRSVSLLAITSGILAVWLAAPSAIFGQTGIPLYWNTASGTGVLWDNAANWWTTSTGPASPLSAAGSTDDAYFDGSTVTGSTIVQLGSPQAALGLYFNTFSNNNGFTTLLESSSSTPETLSIGTDGITVAANSGTVILGDPSNVNQMPVSITGSQTWTNNSTINTLNVFSAISESATSTLKIAGAGGTNISGAISNGTGTLGLTMSGTGTLTLSGANTYTGVTTINGGTLQFNNELSLYNDTTASWTAANIVVASGGTFAVNVGGSGQFSTTDVTTLLTNLDGAVSSNGLEAGSAVGFDTTNASGGTFTISNTIANTTGTGSGAVGLTKLGTNTLVLAGANTYTGPTTISAGTLSLTGTIGGGASGTAISSAATFTESSAGVIAGTSSLLVTAGTTTLAGANIYTGATTINGGTLALTPSTATPVINSVANGSKLMFGGGSLTMAGAAGVNAFQQFNSTTINAGGSSISAIDGSSGGNFDVTLGAITRSAGGAISFTLPANTAALTSNGIATTTNNNAAGILGGYATVGGNWAVSGATAGTVSSWTTSAITFSAPQTAGNEVVFSGSGIPGGLTSGTPYYILASSATSGVSATLGGAAITLGGTSASTAVVNSAGNISALSVYTGALPSTANNSTTANYTLAAAQTQSGVVSANSLNITDTTPGDTLALGANTLTFNNTLGGLLYSGGSSYFINGTGTIGSGASGEFIVTTTGAGNLTINSPLSTSSVTKAGTGMVTLTAANTYTGATTVAGGTLAVVEVYNAATEPLTNTAITVSSGATFAPQFGPGAINFGSRNLTTASLTLNPGSILNMVDGAAGVFNILSKGTPLKINGATLDFDVGVTGTDSVGLIGSAALVNVSGTNTINLVPFGSLLPVSGTYNLITIANASSSLAGTFQFANSSQTESLTVGGKAYTATLSNSAAAESVTIVAQAPTLIWTGQATGSTPASASWDIGTTANWANSTPSAVTYSDGNDVVFGNFNPLLPNNGNNYVNNSTITIQSGGVTPAAVTFNNSLVNYIIMGGPIQGATTTMTLDNNSDVTFLNQNTYGGGTWLANVNVTTIIGSSTMVANGVITSGPLGTGTVTLCDGQLRTSGSIYTLANNIVISANTSFDNSDSGTIIFDGTQLTIPATIALSNSPVLTLGNTTTINDVVTGSSGLTVTASSSHADLFLNGANTYTGITTITNVIGENGLLSVSNLAVEGNLGGTPSSIGESSNAAANLVLSGGTLQYIGNGGTTDRLFTLGAGSQGSTGGTLDASGMGPIVWSNTGAIVSNSGSTYYPLTLTGTNTGANTLTPILTGASTLTKNEGGTWVLAGSNTFTGNTTISGGILAVTGTGQLYAGAGTFTSSTISITTGGTLEVDRWDVGGASGDAYAMGLGSLGNLPSASARLSINGGTIMFTGISNNHTSSDGRGFTIGTSGATLDSATAGQTWYINLNSNLIVSSNSGLLTLNGPGNGVIDQVIPGTGSGLTMSGTGSWTLTNVNTYTGATTLTSGTLVMGSTTTASSALSSSAVTLTTLNNGLQFASGVVSATLGSLAGGGNIVLQNNAGSPAAVALTVGGNNGTTNYSGSLSGPGSLAMAGTGVFSLSGASSYTGTTSVSTSGGTLKLLSTASLGNTAISVASGATFAPQPGSGTLTAGSTGAPGAGASLSLASGAIFNMEDGAVGTFQLQQGSGFGPNALTLGGATLDFDLNGSVGALEVPAVDLLAAGGTASVSGANTINLKLITPTVLNSGGPIPLITASSGLNIGGTFQLSPTSANMTVGGIPYALTLNTTPTALTLTIVSTAATLTWTGAAGSGGAASWDVGMSSNWADSIPMATTYATGDTAVFNDTNAISGLPITNSNIVVQAGGVTPTAVVFNNSAVNYTISDASGPIAGAATLSKSGTGLLSIQNSNNTYARGTTLSDGTLQIIASTTTGGGAITQGPLGTGTLTLSGGTFDNGNSNTITLANSIAITANTSFTTSSGGGALILDGTSLATPATVVLSNNPTLTVNNTTTINDVISGSAQSLTLAGSGTLILGGANTYPGVTTISSGTLQLGNGTNNGSVAGSITDDSALVFLTTGTPSYATAISGSGSVTVNGTGAGALTLSGGNSFQGGLTILGNSVVTLSGANSYSGGTLIQSGTLRAGATNTLPTAGSVTFGGTASATGTLDLNGYGLTVGGLFVAPAAASNSANQIITNSNTSGHGSTATLTYSGAGSNSFAGTLQNGSVSNLLALTVTSGNLTLSGTNTYTGATAVNGGTLQVASPGSLASAVTVSSPATLSGSGAIGGLVTVNSGGVLAPSGVASAATTMTLTGGLTLANGAVLDFNLGIPGSGDSVNVTGGALSLGTTGGTLNINEFGGGGELEATSYPLIFDSSITGNAALWNVGDHVGDTGHSYSFTDTGGQFDLVVSVSSSNATWISPSDSNYNNGPNWSSGTVPSGAGLIVTFGSGSQAMVSVNGSFIVGQLNFNNGGNSGAPTSYLLAGNGNLTLNNSGGGASVNVSSGSLAPSLGANVTLTLADSSLTTTFNIASGSSLVVSGAIGQSSSGQRVVLAGGGTLELESPNTYTGSTTINSGIFQVDSGASIASTSVSIGAGGTLQLVGTTGALPSTTNISTHGTGSAGDGALVLIGAATETVGTISGDTRQITDGSQQVTVYSGNTTVGDGSNSASLTATQILGNTLTINSNSTVTIAPSGSGIPTDAQESEAVSGVALAAGSSTADSDSSTDPFSAIQEAISSGAISSAKGQQLENRIAAIERLAATDPGLDVSLLEDRVLAALPTQSVWSSSGTSPLLDSGTGLLAVDSGTSGSSLGGATAAFVPIADFGGSPAAVPEPSSLLLAAMAGIGILVAIRRRSNARSLTMTID